jgi:hyperosmotically inducible protein
MKFHSHCLAASVLLAVCAFAAPALSAQGALGYLGHGRNAQDPAAVAAAHATDAAEIATTQLIRTSINSDNSLSADAHGVKILTMNGRVTLFGPVASEDEKSAVVAKARAIVGDRSVANQLYVPQTTDSVVADPPTVS